MITFLWQVDLFSNRYLNPVHHEKENIILEKSFDFALSIIKLHKQLFDSREFVISKQILKCGTSIGANVEESTAAQSRNDFISKLSIASKEARETRYWLRLIDKSEIFDFDVEMYLDDIDESFEY